MIRAQLEAARLLNTLKIRSLPVDVNAVAASVGLRVVHEDLKDDVSGLLITRGKAGVIGVHLKDPLVRQRFTIAHEIGHFVLGHHWDSGEHVHVDEGWKVSARNARSAPGIDRREVEANQFAAALLMPESMVSARVAKFKHRPLSDLEVLTLAREFRVSEPAMTYRLDRLGL